MAQSASSTELSRERTLPEPERFLSNLLKAAPIAIFRTDLEGNCTYVNPRWCEIAGISPEQAMGAGWASTIHPDDRARVAAEWYRSVKEVRPVKLDYRFMRPDGTSTWVRGEAFPEKDESGATLGLIGTLRDITERKQVEENLSKANAEFIRNFEMFLEQTTDFIYFKDHDSRFIFCSQTLAKITGHASWRDMIGKHDREVFPADTARIYEEEERPVFAEGKPLLNKVDPFYDADGKPGYVQTNKWPLFDEHGKVAGIFGISRDITALKRVEKEREQYFAFFNTSTDLMVIADPNGAFKKVNPACSQVLGYSEAELLARPFVEFVHPDDRQPTLDEMARQLRLGFTLDFENRYVRKDGSLRWLSWRATVDQTEGLTYATARDVTDRKRAEALIRERDNQQRALLNSIPDLAWIKDREGRFIAVNEPFGRACGVAPEALVGKTDLDIWPKDLANRYRADDQMVMQTGARKRIEEPLVGKDQSISWIETIKLPILNDKQEIIGTCGIARDMTQRKATEESLRKSSSLLQEAQELGHIGAWDFDVQRKKITWTAEVYRIYEVDEGFDPSNIPADVSFYHPDVQARINRAFYDAVEKGEPFDLELRFVGAKGTKKWVRTQARVEREDGKIVRVVGNIIDVTERKTLEEDLRAAVELRDDFLSIASHELKSPLSTLHVQLELLSKLAAEEKTASDSPIATMSQRAFRAVQQLSGLLDDLLDVTQIRVGKVNLEKEDVDLKAAVEECVSRTQEEKKAEGSTITVNAKEHVFGKWDPRRIVQITSNLLSNAVKYGEGKPIEVTVSPDRSSGTVRLLVRDHGMGIPAEMQSKIFERYQRVVSSNKITGLGLGLYIVRQIVEAHGGFIRVESKPGNGSLFVVELPIDTGKQVAPDHPEPFAPPAQAEPPQNKKLRRRGTEAQREQ